MHPCLSDMMRIFRGYPTIYGVYTIEKSPNKKQKGKAATIKETVTAELWNDHLMGKQGLGIIPIDENNLCRFGAIDIDDYNVKVWEVLRQIRDNNLPLIPCKTKSGGLHLYCFVKEPIPAALMQLKLRMMAAFIGYGTAEVFPKQTAILADRGDMGSWINMPYFNTLETTRAAYNDAGKLVDINSFLKLVDLYMTTGEKLIALRVLQSDEISDGPPCLQQLAVQGFPDGTRNNGLLNYGIYAKKKDSDNFPKMIEEFNRTKMIPPLPTVEVLAIINSLRKKEYKYTCKQPPIIGFCNVSVCRSRKHGIGNGCGMPTMGSLTKIDTIPPVWFLDIEDGGRLELTTQQLQYPALFQQRCMDVLNKMPAILKRDDWQEIVMDLLEKATIVEMPPESSALGQLREHLEAFCLSRVQGKSFDDLLLGKPVTLDGKHYFRLRDFLTYLDRMRFREFSTVRISIYIKESCNGVHEFRNIRNRGTNFWSIPEFKQRTGKATAPEQGNEF